MKKITIAVHGGAGPDSPFIQQNLAAYDRGLTEALNAGYAVLEGGGTAVDAVEKAVVVLEDNPLFNAGKGSALNEKAEVQMDACIMSGKERKAGAVCLVRNVKNPVRLARAVMEKGPHPFLGGEGATALAQRLGLQMMPDAYFVTGHAFEQYTAALREAGKDMSGPVETKAFMKDTVGAVALDGEGNVAAATSTGGIENKMLGRIGDSPVIGSGCYAHNDTCAVSATGDGDLIVQHVMAFHLSCLLRYKNLNIEEAGELLLQETLQEAQGDIGLLAIDKAGRVGMTYNTERMHRGYKKSDEFFTATYR